MEILICLVVIAVSIVIPFGICGWAGDMAEITEKAMEEQEREDLKSSLNDDWRYLNRYAKQWR